MDDAVRPEREAAREQRERDLPPVRDDYRRYYSRWHDESDQHFDHMARYYERKLAPFLGDRRTLSVLEIGCGPGFCLGGLQRLGVSAFEGIDADAGQIELARARSFAAHHVPIQQFPAYMAAHRGEFDFVLIFDVLEHVPGDGRLQFLQEIWRALKPGGRIVCQVPNANSFVASRYRYNDATHHTTFTEDSLDFELYRAGFDDISVEEADPIRRPWWRKPREVVRWAMHKALRHAIRRCYELEIGRHDAWRIPLSPNIIATAIRRSDGHS